MTRRNWLHGLLASTPLLGAKALPAPLIDTHVHLFSKDLARFPFAPGAPYRPEPAPLETYLPFAKARLTHAIIVHPEPYQDDHRYLEYCFAHEPAPGFFKGTCLFDPIAPATPSRIAEFVRLHPGRIVALRIHATNAAGSPPLTSGPIKDRDLRSPAMKATWQMARQLRLTVQMHFVPHHPVEIGELCRAFPDVTVILDHLGRAGEGTADEYANVLRLAQYPRVVMKFSGVGYSSKQPFPHLDAKPLVRRAYDAFGPRRMITGGLGMNEQEFRRATELFDTQLDFVSAADRVDIRGKNAEKFFGLKS